ncbi:hypothetical protein IFM89_011915 [Coptis chinensis]|uniref:Uncharacterized protein n=1 Tax=Coptis chinensis TaxID=261450 RepID=A0A835I3B3_9MAGN|nr:hypothetical protein IFM89_011915 [Coptis chinensis]
MAFTLSSKTNHSEKQNKINNNSVDQEEEPEIQPTITRHLYLKPTHSTETLEKDAVLRRIRHCKRVNKVQNALQAMFGSPFSGGSTVDKTWLEDAFSAP